VLQQVALENDVEAILEGRITEVLHETGLESSLPLFPKARWVFPPVDIEFDEPPNELIISPRERIELIHQRPLRADLSVEEIVAIEANEERGSSRSALVEPLAGVATYPSLIEPDWSYQRLVEIKQGVSAGDQVVTAGQNRLFNGMPVTIDNTINPAGGGAQAAAQ
jgi:hypothetical protein